MKQLFFAFFIAAIAFSSCTNKDNENTASENNTGTKYIPVQTTIGQYWYDFNFTHSCTNIRLSDSLCYITMEYDGKDAIRAIADIGDGEIKDIKLPASILNTNLASAYSKFLSNGCIVFAHDCPIYDSMILTQVSQNYIPAGKYPIFLVNSDIVITF